MRILATIMVALLLPLNMSVKAPPARVCAATACCGTNCGPIAPVNQLSCCKAPTAPDVATIQARETPHLDLLGTMPVAAMTIAISHVRNLAVTCKYSSPDGFASIALLCSRQI